MNEWDTKMQELIKQAGLNGYRFSSTITEKTTLPESGNPTRSLTVVFNFENEKK